jgi:hypothetical protein
MSSTISRNKIVLFFSCALFFSSRSFSQNVGVNTTTPEATLDVNGDIIIRTAPLTVADGTTPALDVNTSRFSYYKLTGPTADFTLAGITAGIDGRLVTLFNRSGFAMQLTNEDAAAAVADMIVTGTNATISIPNKGIVNLQYDGDEQKWIVKSSSKGPGPGGAGYWDLNGSDVYNNTSGNVGIGTNSPVSKLTMLTDINTMGWTHIGQVNGMDSIIVSQGIGGVSASLGTATNHTFRLNSGGLGKIHIYPAGEVVVGTNVTPAVAKFTVETPNGSDGIAHISDAGNILMTRIGGTSAGIGTFSNTHMRIFCNSISQIFIAAATGNVGIGTENFGTYKLAVNGNIRSKEVVVESGWADYVFEKNYKLLPLRDVEKFIALNKHLPNIPSAVEIATNGLHLGDTQKKMMEKIEELTLYLIEANKRIERLEQLIKEKN